MRIWYQSGLSFARFSTYERFLREHVKCADPGTDVYVNGTSKGGTGIEYRLTEYFFAREMIENGLKAEEQAFDAYVVGTTNEAGLTECREAVNIPVVGIVEASVHLACVMGRSFALVTPNEKMVPHFEEQVSRYGLRDRLAGIRYTQFNIPDLAKIFEDRVLAQQQVEQFKEGASDLIRCGAEVIIPIGGIAGLFLARYGLREIEGVPVLDTIAIAVKAAEMMAKLKEITGTFVSRRLTYARPSDEVLRQIRKDYDV